MPRERLMETARNVFRSFGYCPIDTPALEYFEVLAGKGGEESDRQMYHFYDHGDRHVAMRFDLTVPLARFVAQHIDKLGTPFKRYHIGTVWRGEKAQAGRYREFVQCDFDTIGTTSIASDVETTLVIHDLMLALGFERFTIRVNSRKFVNGFLQKNGLEAYSTDFLRVVDKTPKMGIDKATAEIEKLNIPIAPETIQMLAVSLPQHSNDQILKQIKMLVDDNELGQQGVSELEEFDRLVSAAGVPKQRIKLDPSIARGLDYYTGTVFETMLDEDAAIGSVCSGGRYDNLAELYTSRQLPGVGASLGLDRLLAAMERLGVLQSVDTPADFLVVNFDGDRLGDYLQIAATIRSAGFGVEVYPESKKLGQQFKYADRKGFAAAIVAGSKEFDDQSVQVKWLSDGSQEGVSVADGWGELVDYLSSNIAQKLN